MQMGKIIYENRHGTFRPGASSRLWREETGHSLPPIFVLNMAHDDEETDSPQNVKRSKGHTKQCSY